MGSLLTAAAGDAVTGDSAADNAGGRIASGKTIGLAGSRFVAARRRWRTVSSGNGSR